MFAVIHFPERKSDDDTDELSQLAEKFSPLYEIVDGRTVAVNIGGLNLIYPGGNEEILEAIRQETARAGRVNIAIGENLSLAILTALCKRGAVIIEASDVLEDVRLENLDLPAGYREIFDEWAVYTVGDLVSLPADELIARLGRGVETIIQKLTAREARPLNRHLSERLFFRRIELEDPVESTQSCLFLIEARLGELAAELSSYALAAEEIVVTVRIDRETSRTIRLRLPLPSLNVRYLVKLLGYEFEKEQIEGLVRGLEVRIIPAPPRRIQTSFWKPPAPDPENLELTLAKLKKLLGSHNVGIPVALDSHDPAAFEIDGETRPQSAENAEAGGERRNFLVFRYFLKGIPVRIAQSPKKQKYLVFENQRQRIRHITGPWLKSGNWWEEGEWSRREMDVQLENGQIFRVVESGSGQFFMEGYYD